MAQIPPINRKTPSAEKRMRKSLFLVLQGHNQFSIHSNYDSHHGSWNHSYACRHCKTSMFIPNDAIFVTRALFIVSFACFIGGVAFPDNGLIYALGGTGALCLFLAVGVWFNRPMKWSGFNSFQSGRSAQTLKEQALNHQCQPTYYECEEFDAWAEQFISSAEIQSLKKKYGEEKKVRKTAKTESSTDSSKSKLFYLAILYAIGFTAVLFFIEKRRMISEWYDQWSHSD